MKKLYANSSAVKNVVYEVTLSTEQHGAVNVFDERPWDDQTERVYVFTIEDLRNLFLSASLDGMFAAIYKKQTTTLPVIFKQIFGEDL